MPVLAWFHSLRRRRKKRKKEKKDKAAQQQSPCRSQAAASAASPAARCRTPPPPLPAASPNRASYYFASADRARQDAGLRCAADAALEVRVDVVHRRASGGRRLGGADAPPGTPELKLRRIVTRHADAGSDSGGGGLSSATTSAATTPSTRARGFHVKPAGGRRRRRRRRQEHDGYSDVNALKEKAASPPPVMPGSPLQPEAGAAAAARKRLWLYESLVVVKASPDPEREIAESMAEMVVANGIRAPEDLEELLACYLALNAAEHHRAVVAAFRRVWCLLARLRLHHHHHHAL